MSLFNSPFKNGDLKVIEREIPFVEVNVIKDSIKFPVCDITRVNIGPSKVEELTRRIGVLTKDFRKRMNF